MVYSISVLNVAWWTASGRKQKAASDIDVSICVWTCVCVSIFIIKVVYIHIHCMSVRVIERKTIIKQPSYLCSSGQWWRQEWRQSRCGRLQRSKLSINDFSSHLKFYVHASHDLRIWNWSLAVINPQIVAWLCSTDFPLIVLFFSQPPILLFLFSFAALIRVFSCNRQMFSVKTILRNPLYATFSAPDKQSLQQACEHSGACWYLLKSQIFPSGVDGDQNRDKRTINMEFTYAKPETWLKMTASFA